jgi:endonuclease YncB( thermonuclease family)
VQWKPSRKTGQKQVGSALRCILECPCRSSLIASVILPMRSLLFSVALLTASQSWAASPVVRDGGTIQLADVTYKLNGIDAPEVDQICIDEHADTWACGVAARDQLTSLIGGHQVRCEDLGADTTYKKRHIGMCTLEGETVSLNQLLVRQGFALNVETAKGSFNQDEAEAKEARRGLWKGCFAAPQEFRHGRKDGALLGGSCRPDKDSEIRTILFPDHPAMPSGCSIKGKFAVRARVTGNVGIYQMQGCRNYPALTKPDRWFCSEDDAQAAGFRRAYNCRSSAGRSK